MEVVKQKPKNITNYRKDFTAELPILKSILKEKISSDVNLKEIYDNAKKIEPQ